jgi:hypothetical protein
VESPPHRVPRRALLREVLAAVRTVLPTTADEYEVVAQWALPAGGVGLFVAAPRAGDGAALEALIARLRARYAAAPNLVVQVFDDADAARTVRAGARRVDEAAFAAALAHQRAGYQRSAARRVDRLTIHTGPPRIVDFPPPMTIDPPATDLEPGGRGRPAPSAPRA